MSRAALLNESTSAARSAPDKSARGFINTTCETMRVPRYFSGSSSRRRRRSLLSGADRGGSPGGGEKGRRSCFGGRGRDDLPEPLGFASHGSDCADRAPPGERWPDGGPCGRSRHGFWVPPPGGRSPPGGLPRHGRSPLGGPLVGLRHGLRSPCGAAPCGLLHGRSPRGAPVGLFCHGRSILGGPPGLFCHGRSFRGGPAGLFCHGRSFRGGPAGLFCHGRDFFLKRSRGSWCAPPGRQSAPRFSRGASGLRRALRAASGESHSWPPENHFMTTFAFFRLS